MKSEMKKSILMHGPCFGHNVKFFLDFFNKKSHYKLTYLFVGRQEYNNKTHPNVRFIRISLTPLSILKFISIILRKWDLLWIHGGYSLKLLGLLVLMKNPGTKVVLNIWGNYVPKILIKNSVNSILYRLIFQMIDFIQCNWYGTYLVLKSIKAGLNLEVNPWGLDNIYFRKKDNDEISEFTSKFVSNLPKEAFKIFYPKSIIPLTRHDLLINAAKILVDKKINNFIIYIWVGNMVKEGYFQKYRQMIKEYELEDFVKIVKHPFLPFFDLKKIWQEMDCGYHVIENDQLSTAFIEPMLFKKELIASNILAYRIFNRKFNIDLKLIDLKPEIIANSLESLIKGERTSKDELLKRKQIILDNFVFDDNLLHGLRHYLE